MAQDPLTRAQIRVPQEKVSKFLRAVEASRVNNNQKILERLAKEMGFGSVEEALNAVERGGASGQLPK